MTLQQPYFHEPRLTLWHANALDLPLPDESVDLIVTSPPYFGLRSYTDGGEHYAGQVGSEATPAEFLDALIAATREMVRVLKPSGSIWVNLGDKYNAYNGNRGDGHLQNNGPRPRLASGSGLDVKDIRPKSLLGIPWRYAIRCIDELGLILRAEVIWSKPNGLPESVTDRVRRSHEQWFHFTVQPRYFSAVDEVREAAKEPHRSTGVVERHIKHGSGNLNRADGTQSRSSTWGGEEGAREYNPLGKLPGSVWEVPTQPLTVPAHLGIDHFAAFPMEWPRRIIKGWAPTAGVCVECGEGRRPVTVKSADAQGRTTNGPQSVERRFESIGFAQRAVVTAKIAGYACACPEPTAPTTPAVVLDPFGGTGTTALVAYVLGCHGHSVDLSADYCRLAQWRVTDPGQRVAAHDGVGMFKTGESR